MKYDTIIIGGGLAGLVAGATLTFHSDFHLKFGEELVIVNDQITLLFVKTKDGWKMVHEHHSPLKKIE